MAWTPVPARMAGLTLVELLATLSILAVSLALGVPSFLDLMARQTLSLEREKFAAAFNNARLLAISGNQRVTLCPSLDGESCQSDPHWERGWVQFVDRNGNREHDPGERLMRSEPASAGGVTIRSPRSRRRITYQPNGLAPGTNLTLTFCHAAAPGGALALVVSNAGRARRSDERPGGGALECP